MLAGLVDTSATGTPNYDMAVARLLADGTLDSGFGFGGRTVIAYDLIANGTDNVARVIEQSNRRLLLVGYASSGPAVKAAAARLHADGSLDEQFGQFGKQTYDFGLTTPAAQVFDAVALQGTQVITAGFSSVPGGPSAIDVIVTRLDIDVLFADGFE